MSRIAPCLWFVNEAEEATRYYVSLLPDSRIDSVHHNHFDGPSGPAGSVLIVAFTLAGQPYLALNGGAPFPFTQAISLAVECDDQAEIDRLWAALGDGGMPVQCGWIRDRYGLSWQVVPKGLSRLLDDSDPAAAARVLQAVMGMVKLDMAAMEAARAGG